MYIAIIDSTNCSHGDIKLTGGKSSNEGDVQICVNGTWGYICGWYWYYWYSNYWWYSNNWYWYNVNNTNVLCKELGYTSTQCKMLLKDFLFSIHNIGNSFGRSNFFGGSRYIAPIVRDRINCIGNETALTECTYYTYYSSSCTIFGAYCAGTNLSLF